ncbi:MAG: GNAT family N-acetyltransferase [Pseudomonadota bacterium]
MTFDPQPCLENDHVRLRPMQAADFETLYAVASDPDIWAQHPAHDRHERAVFREFFDAGMAGGACFVIFDRKTDEMIGSSRYHGFDAKRSRVEIGWTFLARSHWGGPWNRAVKALMLDHAFRFVDRVVLYAGSDNHRSRRAIEKIDGVADGMRDDGGGRHSVRYVVRRPG